MRYSKLSIVMPVYNEIKTIREIIDRVLSVDVGMEKELIIVDDCSTDGTREFLKDLEGSKIKGVRIFFHDKNRGKGAALRTAFEHVTGDVTIIQDADLEYDPSDYPQLLKPIIAGECDVVYGSRFIGPKSTYRRPKGMALSNFLANRFLTMLTNVLTGFKITDMETCYKLMKTSILRELRLESERFNIEPEITAKLAKKKVRLKEVPISYHGRDHSEGKKIKWKDGFSAIYHIFRYVYLH